MIVFMSLRRGTGAPWVKVEGPEGDLFIPLFAPSTPRTAGSLRRQPGVAKTRPEGAQERP